LRAVLETRAKRKERNIMNELVAAIADRGALLGTLVSVASPAMSEALSATGLDWLFFDLEHSVLDLAAVQSMIQAMQPGCLSFIRVEDPAGVYVKRALDTGCSGVIVPQVNSVAIAKALVQAAKFAPLGARGVGLGRAVGYGASLSEGLKRENQRTSLVAQIEHIDAVEVVGEIVALEGIDGVLVGPYDLSSSLGIPGEIGDPRVQERIQRVLDAARKVGKPAGIFVGAAEAARREIARGFSFVAVGSDLTHLSAATRALCGAVRPQPV
jgi:2-keto-3-deoxy-L-rhamnonate aldolase RhmA